MEAAAALPVAAAPATPQNARRGNRTEIIDWDELKCIPSYAPLAELPYVRKQLDERLFQLREDIYLAAVPTNPIGERDRGPYVTMVMWAESEGAAKRSFNGDVEADVSQPFSSPPAEILLPGAALTYGEIIAALKERGLYESSLRYAKYRMTDGIFINAIIDTQVDNGGRRYRFCFRSPECEESAVPYAIHHVLKDR